MKNQLVAAKVARIVRLLMLPVLMAAALGSAPQRTVYAVGSTITVDTLDGGLVDGAGSGDCSLAEAIHNANVDGGGSPYADCALGSADDTINFSVTGTITLAASLPTIDDPQNERTYIDGDVGADGDADIVIDGNDAYEIISIDGPASFKYLTIQNANDGCCSGGAVYVMLGGDLWVERVLFYSNDALGTGGAILNYGLLNINRSTFAGNSAGTYGGAIDSSGGNVLITNSTFMSNSASTAGGAIYSGSTLTAYNNTFSQNSAAAGEGAAVHLGAGTATLRNNILANSTAGDDCENNGTLFASYNLVEDSSPACGMSNGVNNNIVGLDPMLGPSSGAPAYFPLKYGSPATDAGDSDYATGSFDEPGNPRISDIPWAADTGFDAGSGVVDMGAYESYVYCIGGAQYYVDADATGAALGTSWTDAFPDLQMALDTIRECGAPDDVWVAEGVYYPDGGAPDDPSASFIIPPGADIYGGFAGTEANWSERLVSTNVTVLSGDITGNDTNKDVNGVIWDAADIVTTNTHHVVLMDGTATDITTSTNLDGFTITGGHASPDPNPTGAGLHCEAGGGGGACSPTLSNLVFAGNRADAGGGLAIHPGATGTSSPALFNVRFEGNWAQYYGGALGVFSFQGTASPDLYDVTFHDNTAGVYGGAIYADASSGTANGTMTSVTFSSNHATIGGGYFAGASNGTANPSLTNVTFSGNTASDAGGAMYNYSNGGVASPTLTNVTFQGNSATSTGGALYNDASGSGTSNPVLINAILWGNTAGIGGYQIFNDAGATPVISYSLIEDSGGSGGGWDTALGTDGGNNLDADPLLGPLAFNGGLTKTMALLQGSPAINSAQNAACPAYDQRGVDRPKDGTCDIGAYEATLGDTIGITANGIFYLRNANASGPADNTFGFGWNGPLPLVGDWDNDDVETIGIDDGGWFFLRNSNSAGGADLIFQFGWAGATPLVGDWDGDGTDTVGLYSGGWFFLRNSNSPGPADLVFSFGWDGPTPIVGDWNGDGVDTIGIHSGDTFFLRNSNSSGPADNTFSFGWAGPTPLVGDWNGDGADSIGIVDGGIFYLRDANSAGAADLTFGFGWGGATPLAGTWDQLP